MKQISRRSVAIIVAFVVVVSTFVGVRSLLGGCQPSERSVATVWNEATLDAIRRDFPAPTVHSRNLYHLSAAMWDVWAAYDPTANGVYMNEPQEAEDIRIAREEAISFAAHRLLVTRYADSVSSEESLAQFDETLSSLCYDRDASEVAGSPAAFGVEVADKILVETLEDGSLETSGYVDPNYMPVNEPLVVDESGAEMADPNRWQPLALAEQVTQNGQKLDASTQEFIGSNWGYVTPFAIAADPDDGLPYDPGPPPLLGTDDDEFIEAVSEVAELSSRLDPQSDKTIDISPAATGDVKLGTYTAVGRDENPVTGEPYESNIVPEADYGRVIAEYWADGPDSETPPGHWNTLAIEVGDQLETENNLTIDAGTVDRLEWDVKIMLALNGALHDTAIAVWGAKAHYDYARPISMIRHLGQQGQLLEKPGVIERITEETAAEGEKHNHLKDYIGEQALYAWLGEPDNPETTVGGVGWIRAADWMPYQRESFVSPAFAAYVSGHSGFSRAAAEVLTELTGTPYFPGGIATHTVKPGELIHEIGPTETITLQWATYQDAADQAGISRLYGGIHVQADDLQGRIIGEQIGQQAVDKARSLM